MTEPRTCGATFVSIRCRRQPRARGQRCPAPSTSSPWWSNQRAATRQPREPPPTASEPRESTTAGGGSDEPPGMSAATCRRRRQSHRRPLAKVEHQRRSLKEYCAACEQLDCQASDECIQARQRARTPGTVPTVQAAGVHAHGPSGVRLDGPDAGTPRSRWASSRRRNEDRGRSKAAGDDRRRRRCRGRSRRGELAHRAT